MQGAAAWVEVVWAGHVEQASLACDILIHYPCTSTAVTLLLLLGSPPHTFEDLPGFKCQQFTKEMGVLCRTDPQGPVAEQAIWSSI